MSGSSQKRMRYIRGWLCGGTVGQASVSADVKGSLRTASPPPVEKKQAINTERANRSPDPVHWE